MKCCDDEHEVSEKSMEYRKWNTLSAWPKNTKVYISGKISGDAGYRAKFHKAMEFFVENGFVVLNPAFLPEGMTTAEYMSINFPMIFAADLVAFLPDHKVSKGAELERMLCEYIDKPRIYIAGNLDWVRWNDKRMREKREKFVAAVNKAKSRAGGDQDDN